MTINHLHVLKWRKNQVPRRVLPYQMSQSRRSNPGPQEQCSHLRFIFSSSSFPFSCSRSVVSLNKDLVTFVCTYAATCTVLRLTTLKRYVLCLCPLKVNNIQKLVIKNNSCPFREMLLLFHHTAYVTYHCLLLLLPLTVHTDSLYPNTYLEAVKRVKYV